MKRWLILPLLTGLLNAEPQPPQEHAKNAEKLANEQDELSADVQQLVAEQIAEPVIKLLKETESLMGEATEQLAKHDTGGQTIAIQTEILEKIYEAAKAKQQQKQQQQGDPSQQGDQQQQGSGSGSGMMKMLENMLGKGQEQKAPGQPGQQAGDQAGQGQTGDSNSANQNANGAANGKSETRKVPKAAGTGGAAVPEEFRQALDAYNRGANQLPK